MNGLYKNVSLQATHHTNVCINSCFKIGNGDHEVVFLIFLCSYLAIPNVRFSRSSQTPKDKLLL